MGTWIEARPSLVIPGVIDTIKGDEAHITLAYLGDMDHDEVVDAMNSQAKNFYVTPGWLSDPIIAEVSGIARWLDAKNKPFIVALVSPAIPRIGNDTIYTLRGNIVRKLQTAGVEVNDEYPFIPHITLTGWSQQANAANAMMPVLKSRIMFRVGEIYVSTGSANQPDTHKQTLITG